MLITDEEVSKRLNSPLNLINKMRNNNSSKRNEAMSLFGIGRKEINEINEITTDYVNKHKAPPTTFTPAARELEDSDPDQSEALIPEVVTAEDLQSPQIDNILDNVEAKLKLELVHNEALDALVSTVQAIKTNLCEVTNPTKLAAMAVQLNKVVESIRGERNKTQGNKEVHLHFYTPTQKKITDYHRVAVNA